ncbi:MAG: hypothetical protein AAF618_04880 [Pseudomonadota bacterium]
MLLYPAILFPKDGSGLAGCIVPDLLINASGSSDQEAVEDAVAIMDDLIAEMRASGEDVPEPSDFASVAREGGTLIVLHHRTLEAAE